MATAPPRLSKSKITAGLQCERRLWLETFHRGVVKVSTNARAAFDVGNEVGNIARVLFGPGRLVQHVRDINRALEETAELLGQAQRTTLFETAFRHAEVLVRADVLQPVDGGYDLIEVKSSTSVKDYQINDCAIQAWVAQNAGVSLRRVVLAYINNAFVYRGSGDYSGLLTTEDVTDVVRERMQDVPGWVNRLQQVLQGPEPEIHTGPQCHEPFECPCFTFCRSQEPAGPKYPVEILPRAGKLLMALKDEGYVDLCDVPAARLTNSHHQRVHSASISGERVLDHEAARVVNQLKYPRYYLDFETVSFAVPRWAGTRPYQQLPFQWSCHIEYAGSPLKHKMFLDLSGADPIRSFAESLCDALGHDGPILVYNMTFERSRVLELAGMLPDLTERLEALVPRIVDLLPVAREHYYHPDMMGSWSIKKVIPTIAPELDYGDLDGVASSGDAPLAYLEATSPATSPARRRELDYELRRYCANDTMAMVKLVQAFAQA